MKETAKLLAQTTIVSVAAIPLTIIGMGIGGWIWSEKVEPWLEQRKEKSGLTKWKGLRKLRLFSYFPYADVRKRCYISNLEKIPGGKFRKCF